MNIQKLGKCHKWHVGIVNADIYGTNNSILDIEGLACR